jgi:hypothetical protein
LDLNSGAQIVPVNQLLFIGHEPVKIAEFEPSPSLGDRIVVELLLKDVPNSCAFVQFSLDSLIPYEDKQEFEGTINQLSTEWSVQEAFSIMQTWNNPMLMENRPLSMIQRADGKNC